ncbi:MULTISPECIES: PepSY-associated TM helix domain-containing protein [unclassified Imperialibacter]|uniref:PepSY-associated TM helix domain-containing protein n=1 Tax=unclassified Imperialibacter TaxID=2629706 RepID=UPI0012517C68
MKLTARNTHRDIAYFYIGLIIAFSFSGIFLNHRRVWHPSRVKYTSQEITMTPVSAESINDDFIKSFSATQSIDDQLRRYSMDGNTLRVSYANQDVTMDVSTGNGKLEKYMTTPLLGQMTKLHVDTSDFWIYYSDIFGVAMLVIAFTGMFIVKGDKSFRKRGWKLAAIGLVFPLIFLFLLG